MTRLHLVAATAAAVLVAPTAWAQPVGQASAGALPPPLGPALSCADFVHNPDKTWSITHQATINGSGVSATLWPGTHFAIGLSVAGIDVAALVDQACGGPPGPPHPIPQPNPVTPTPIPPPTPHQQDQPPNQISPNQLPPPFGPLTCADFIHNPDGTWQLKHAATLSYQGASVTLYPTTRFTEGVSIAGLDVASVLDPDCAGTTPHASQPTPPNPTPPYPTPPYPTPPNPTPPNPTPPYPTPPYPTPPNPTPPYPTPPYPTPPNPTPPYPTPHPTPTPGPGCPTLPTQNSSLSPSPSPNPSLSPNPSPGPSPSPNPSPGASLSPSPPPGPSQTEKLSDASSGSSPDTSPSLPPDDSDIGPGQARYSTTRTPPGPTPEGQTTGRPGTPPPAPPPGTLPPPLGPNLSCSDFTHNADGTWSAAHPVRITTSAASMTLFALAHFGPGGSGIFVGVDVGAIVDRSCGGE
jgi:hypothetical protein